MIGTGRAKRSFPRKDAPKSEFGSQEGTDVLIARKRLSNRAKLGARINRSNSRDLPSFNLLEKKPGGRFCAGSRGMTN
jgi:hypothetical protein